MHPIKSAFLAGGISLLLPWMVPSSVQAQAEQASPSGCRVIIDAAGGRWSIDSFDLDGAAVPFKQFQLALTNTGSETCSGNLEAEIPGEPFGLLGSGPVRIPYTLVDETAGRDLTPRTGETRRSSPTRGLSIAPGETVTRIISLLVDPSRVQSDGVFAQRVRLHLTDSELATLASREVSLELSVNPSVAIRLVGAISRGAGVTINLGELTSGVHQSPLQLQVQSTRGYAMDITSENQGALALGETGWTAPYALLLGNERVNLSEPVSVERRGLNERLDRYEVGFEVGDVEGLRAGRYSDLITVSVRPL